MTRDDIVSAVVTGLSGTFNNVFEWKVTEYDASELPAINVRDGNSGVRDRATGLLEHSLTLFIDVVVSDGENTKSTLRSMTKQLIEAVGTLDLDCWYQGMEFGIENADRLIGGATVTFEVYYETQESSI